MADEGDEIAEFLVLFMWAYFDDIEGGVEIGELLGKFIEIGGRISLDQVLQLRKIHSAGVVVAESGRVRE